MIWELAGPAGRDSMWREKTGEWAHGPSDLPLYNSV